MRSVSLKRGILNSISHSFCMKSNPFFILNGFLFICGYKNSYKFCFSLYLAYSYQYKQCLNLNLIKIEWNYHSAYCSCDAKFPMPRKKRRYWYNRIIFSSLKVNKIVLFILFWFIIFLIHILLILTELKHRHPIDRDLTGSRSFKKISLHEALYGMHN